MKIEDQVCSLEQALKLKRLGAIQNSLFYFVVNEGKIRCCINDKTIGMFNDHAEPIMNDKPIQNVNCVAAFTVAELGLMIPDEYFLPTNKGKDGWWISNVSGNVPKLGSTEAEARATLLIAILENSTTLTPESFNN